MRTAENRRIKNGSCDCAPSLTKHLYLDYDCAHGVFSCVFILEIFQKDPNFLTYFVRQCA